jgi:hypothetical protein
MGVLTPSELAEAVGGSPVAASYAATVDRESAFEMLSRKLEASGASQDAPPPVGSRRSDKTTLEKVLADPMTRQIGRTVAREVTRGLLGILGLGAARSRKRSLF